MTAQPLPAQPLDDVDELIDLRTLSRHGYGNREVISKRIRSGEIPAVMVGNRYAIRRRDLHLLAKPVTPSDRAELRTGPGGLPAFVRLLSDDQCNELRRLLDARTTAPSP